MTHTLGWGIVQAGSLSFQRVPTMKTERDRPIERLADTLQACFDESARNAAQQVKDELVPRLDKMDTRLDRQDETIRRMGERMDVRLDRQDATLRKFLGAHEGQRQAAHRRAPGGVAMAFATGTRRYEA